ncbi:MAG TPA: cupin domain-containing protein, partial [Thermoleophilaceae bacterium]|nr:cupin domain-containing protein [Thermoleophilaceae bacterium]
RVQAMNEPLATYTTHDGSEYSVIERPEVPDGALVMSFRLLPSAGSPPPHLHPQTVEVFEVLEGELEMLVGRAWRTARAGESVTVNPGVRHTFRNTSGAEVIVRNVHDPHHGFEVDIRSIARVSQQMQAMTPRSPRAAMQMALLWRRHDDLIRPADAPMRAAFGLLQGVGRLTRQSPPQ